MLPDPAPVFVATIDDSIDARWDDQDLSVGHTACRWTRAASYRWRRPNRVGGGRENDRRIARDTRTPFARFGATGSGQTGWSSTTQ